MRTNLEPGEFTLRRAATVGELRLALADLCDGATVYVNGNYDTLKFIDIDHVGDVLISGKARSGEGK